MSGHSPSLDVRYTAANLEKGARVQARQFVQITFTAMLATLITLMMQSRESLEKFTDLQALALSGGSAVFGLVVAAWVGQQDFLIGLLDSYCRELEAFGERDRPASDGETTRKVPCWHQPDRGWISRGFDSRFWINNAFGLILIGTALPNTTLLYMTNHRQFATLLLGFLFVCSFVLRIQCIPRIVERKVKTKYFIVSSLLILSALILAALSFQVKDQPVGANYDYHQMVGSVSCMISVGTIALYVWFERKRCRVLFAGRYDEISGVFSIDPARLQVVEKRWERVGKHVISFTVIVGYLAMIIGAASSAAPIVDLERLMQSFAAEVSFLARGYSTLWISSLGIAFSMGIIIARVFRRYGS